MRIVLAVTALLAFAAQTAVATGGFLPPENQSARVLVLVADNAEKKKKQKKNEDGSFGQCKFMQKSSAGKCAAGLKFTCVKKESCCGCVPDHKATKKEGPTQPPPKQSMFACTSNVIHKGKTIPNRRSGIRATTAADAKSIYESGISGDVVISGPVTCVESSAP